MQKVKKNKNSLKSFLKENLYLILIWVAVSLSLLFFIKENIGRALFVEALLLVWLGLGLYKRNFIVSSLALLIFVIPLNITVSFPSLGDPYVRGVFTNFLSPTLSILDFFSVITLLSFLFGKVIKLNNLPKWMYFVIAYFLIHIVLHPNVVTAISSFRIAIYVPTVFFTMRYFKGLRRKESLFISVFLTIVLQFVIAFLQLHSGKSLGLAFMGESNVLAGTLNSSFVETSYGSMLRGYGTFPHPNVLAAYMLMIMTSLLWFKGVPKRFKMYVVVCVVLSALTVLFTLSRVGIMVLFLILFLYVLKPLLSQKNTYVFFPYVLIERITNLLTNADNSWRDRYELSKHAFEVVRGNWLLGIGQGNYVSSMREIYITTANNLLLLQPVHNIYLLMLSEYGIIMGPLMLGGLIYQICRRLIVKKEKLFVLSNAFIIIFFGLSDHFFLSLPQGLFMILLLLFI